MKIQCENCSIEHELDPPAWVVSSGRPFRFRCSSCGHSQMVSASGNRAEPAPLAVPAASTPRPAAEEATTEPRSSAPAVTASTATPAPAPSAAAPGDSPPIYLKQEGKVYLVRDWATVQRWIMERRVEREDLVSEGGVRWEPVGSRAELGSFFAAVEQLEAVEQTGPGPATPAPAPFASSNPFPFGSPDDTEDELGSSGRFGRLDDDTEGVPMGLPPLPTEETDIATGAADTSAYPDLPPTRGRGRATETLAPTAAFAGTSKRPSIANDPTLPPELAAKLPPGVNRALLAAETIPDISPPALATPSPAPRIDRPISQRQTMPIPPEDPDFAMPSETEEVPNDRTASLPPDDVFSGYHHADGVAPAVEDWEQPRRGVAPWVFAAAAIATAVILVAVVGTAIVMNSGSRDDVHAGAPDDGAQLHAVLPSTEDPPTEATAQIAPPVPEGTDPPPEAPPEAEVATVASTEAGTAEPPPVAKEPATTGAVTKAATPPPEPKAASVSSLVDKGWGAVDKGKLDAASATFKQAVSQNPEHADANFGYGYVLLKQGQRDLAKKHLCRALQNAGGSSDVGREANGMLQNNGMSCG